MFTLPETLEGLTTTDAVDALITEALEEFRAIGDIEGARSLAEEVMNESSGTLQSKARTFLADLA